MRSFFMVCGFITAVPQIWFLLIHQLPAPFLPVRHPDKRWWLATMVRTLSLSQLLNGARLAVVNSVNIDKPLTFSFWWDTWFAVVTIGMSALASVLFLAVYLRYRDWEAS